MSELKTSITFLTLSRLILVFFAVILIIVLPQLNIQEYILSTITSKLIYFLYASMGLLVLYVFTIIFSKTISLSFSKIDLALLILVFYITLNRYFIQSYYGFSFRYIELLGLSFFYIVLRSISLKNYSWLLLAIVISGIMQAVYGNLQLFEIYTSNHSGFKMTGSFFNPGPFAGFLVSVWIIVLGMYLFKDSIITQVQSMKNSKFLFLNEVIKFTFDYIPLLGLFSIAVVVPVLQSRASWIAALVGSGVLMELKYHFLKNGLKKITVAYQKIIVILLSIGILAIGLFGLYHYKKGSSDGRALIWKVTTKMITDTPVFGVGFDRFNANYMNYQGNYFAENEETGEVLLADNVYYAFNECLQFAAENGLFGFLLLLIVLFVLFQAKTNQKNVVEVFIAKTGLMTIGIFACFSYPMQILPIKVVLILLVAILSNCSADSFKIKSLNPYPCKQQRIGEAKERGTFVIISINVFYRFVLVFVASVAMYQTYSYTNKLSLGFVAWKNALNSYDYGDYKGAIQKFELVYPIFEKDGNFLMNYGKTLSMTGESHKAISVLEKAMLYQNNTIIATAVGDSYKATKQYDKAEKAYQKAINMVPGKFYAHYLLVKLYDVSGQRVKAVTMAKKVLKKEIKIPSTAIKEIQIEMKNILMKYKNPLGFKN